MKIIVSACLLGMATRYDGNSKFNEELYSIIKNHEIIPLCPEQLGGLATPRKPNEIRNGKVIELSGKDNTELYIKGAEETMRIAQLLKCNFAILKEGSPSCGRNNIHDGTFSGSKIPGQGITTRLLLNNGVTVLSEKQISEIKKILNKQ